MYKDIEFVLNLSEVGFFYISSCLIFKCICFVTLKVIEFVHVLTLF